MVLEYHELGVQFSFLLSNTASAKSHDDFLKTNQMGKKCVIKL